MIKFERDINDYGDSLYTAVLKIPECDDLVLGVIEKGEWVSPKAVRYEVYLGERKAPGAYPDAYKDTLAEAKDYVLMNVRRHLARLLPKQGEPSVGQKKRAAIKAARAEKVTK